MYRRQTCKIEILILGCSSHQGGDDQAGYPDGWLSTSETQGPGKLLPHGCPLFAGIQRR